MNPRIHKLLQRLTELEVDAFLVTDEVNVGYLSHFTGDSSYLLVQPTETTILTDGRYATQVRSECPGLTAAVRPPGMTMMQLVRDVVSGSNANRIGIEAASLSLATFRQLRENCDGVTWCETSGEVENLRTIKEEGEIDKIRESIHIAQQTFTSVVAKLRRHWTEREIAHEFEATMRFLGAEGVSFPPIIAGGAAGALPHYLPAYRSISGVTSLLIDWGAFYQGYASDITRTLHASHVSDAFCRAYDAVLEAQLSAIESIRPGVEARAVDEAARRVLRRQGLAEAFQHGLGHGIGLQIHESPRMSSISEETLRPGMIVTVEPGVYFEGDFGIRIEDDVLVTDEGHQVLSSLPKGLDDCRLML